MKLSPVVLLIILSYLTHSCMAVDEIPIGRYSEFDDICLQMVDCHRSFNQTDVAVCLNQNIEQMHQTIHLNRDDPDLQLSGMYYIKIALSNHQNVDQEFNRLQSVQHHWARKRQNIIQFLFQTFQNITSNTTNTSNVTNEYK